MADEVAVSVETFNARIAKFVSQWRSDRKSNGSLSGGADAVILVMGKSDEAAGFQKTNALQYWLLGYEFPATLMLITLEKCFILTSTKKGKHVEGLTSGKFPVQLLLRGKDQEENNSKWDEILQHALKAGRTLGLLLKDKMLGPFYDEWKTAFDKRSTDFDVVDASTLVSLALAVKDHEELRAMRDGSKAAAALMEEYFVPEMSELLDSETKITHAKLARQIQNRLEDPSFFSNKKLGLPEGFDPNMLDVGGNIVIQSGGNFDLRKEAVSDDSELYPGVVICRIPVRYNSYSSIVARTYLIDPTKEQEKVYRILCEAHRAMLDAVRDGMMAKEVIAKAINIIKNHDQGLLESFVKAAGTGIGLELRDGSFLVNAKSPHTLRDGQTITIISGLAGLDMKSKDPRKQTYSLMLMDTVRVAIDRATVFTSGASMREKEVLFFFNEEEPKEEKPKSKEKTARAINPSNVVKSKLRSERAVATDDGAEQRRKEHQKELHQKKQSDGKAKYPTATGPITGEAPKMFKKFESYKRDNQLPSKVRELMIVVDERSHTVILPIMGRPVPFHINTIKNSSANDEGEYMQLRINFLSPGQGVGRKDDRPFEDPNAHFVRSLTYRSKDMARITGINDIIQSMKKEAQKREADKKQMEDVVDQDNLIVQSTKRPLTLNDLSIRPALEGKRIVGNLEIHQNGVRYVTGTTQHHGSHKVDVLFSNVRHLFFQPCVQEMIVIIHFHLISPIMIGKKKTKDVQFYREAIEMAADETGNKRRKHNRDDADELRAEQEERKARVRLDATFNKFAGHIAEAGRDFNIDVDVPYRELGFQGVPFRSSVFMQPTSDALVQLIEFPPTCLTLEDVEICHLERVQYGLKNFDMVFVFKDYIRTPMHINTVPVESLESVKEWLDSVNIPFSEGRLNLNLGVIMKTVVADPHAFFAEGGWGFIADESDSEGGSDDEEEESNFEADSDDLASEQSSEYSDEGSDFDENASDDGESEASEEDEDGDDWDELERKAKKRDREGEFDSADEGSRKKSRR